MTASVTVSQRLAAWAHRSFHSPAFPAAVRQTAHDHVVDTVSVVLGGTAEPPVAAARAACAGRSDAAARALVLGTAAHALDYDNAQLPSMVHPSCAIVPSVLASGGTAVWDRVLRAVAMGEEVALWLGEAAVHEGSSRLFERGLHPTAVCGPVGAAVAVGLLGGADVEGLAHAVGVAASMSGGLLEGNRTGGSVKPVHAGLSAHHGVLAADLAAAGLTAPPTALEGRFGFGTALLGAPPDPSLLPDGDEWLVQSVLTKPFPTNGFAHAAISAAVTLREQGFRPEPGGTIKVGVPEPVLRTLAEPRAEKLRPSSPYAARFSGPVLVAIALRGGSGLGVGLADVERVRDDAELLALAATVEIVADAEHTRAFPARLGSTVRATAGGRTVAATVTEALGSRDHPLTPAQVRAKYDDCAAVSLDRPAAERLWQALGAADCAAITSALFTVISASQGGIEA